MRKDELSSARLEIRLTEAEKQSYRDYCEKHDMTMSEFIRETCNNRIIQEGK